MVNGGGGYNNARRDTIENCGRGMVLPYTDIKGTVGNCIFFVKTAEYKGKDLHSEIDVKGTGTVIFPETDLLSDRNEITYSSSNNTLSLKMGLDQDNQYTLDIKNYIDQSNNKSNFTLIDKNGSNIVPRIKRSGSSTVKVNSFELHTEYSLDNFDAVENHYREILNNNKGYKVFGVVRDKVQNQSNSAVPHMMFGSSEDDVINFDQGTMFARGGGGKDMYFVGGNIGEKVVKIDNNSDDKKLDVLFMPEVPKEFSTQQCNLYLNYNDTRIQVEKYLQGDSYAHLMVMNSKGETFIPYIQSMSCTSSSVKNGKLVPFFYATQTQNMFFLSKDFEYDHVVIDSRSEDIEQYKDKGDLLLIRESEVPFIIRIEGVYNDRSKWKDVTFSLWNNGNFSYFDLPQEIDGVMSYQDKLKDDYEKVIKEYVIDFNQSVDIKHNQNDSLASIEQDKERIGVIVLKGITPDQVKVSSSGSDLVLRDTKSNRTINIKNWDNSKSYRISTLEFDLGLDPIKICRLDRFSLSSVAEIQDLVNKASENYQKKTKSTTKVENDLKCLVSVNGFENGNKTYECLGFSSLQEQINFTENFCSLERIKEFKDKIPNNNQVIPLLKKLQNGLVLNGYDQGTIDQCFKLTLASEPEILKLLISKTAQDGKWDEVKVLLDKTANRSNADIENKNKWSKSWTLLHYAVYNGNLNLMKGIFELLLGKVGDINARDEYDWTPLHYAAYYNEPGMVTFLIDKHASIETESKKRETPMEVANTYSKLEVISTFINKAIEKGKSDVVKNFFKRNPEKFIVEDKDEWRTNWTLLHYAAYNGRLDIIQGSFDLLLEKSGGDINVKENQYYYTPLHYAIHYNRPEMVKLFLDKGANIEAKDKYDKTPLHLAAREGYLDIVNLLLDKGADIEAKDKYDRTPLQFAEDKKRSNVVQLLKVQCVYTHGKRNQIFCAIKEGRLDLIKILLSKGNNIKAVDSDGKTPLHYAVEYNKFDAIKLFIGHNAIDINVKSLYNETPLHTAAQQGCIASISLLLDNQAKIEAQDWNGKTPLHHAAYYNKPDAVKYLISRNANVNAKDHRGNIPAYYALGGNRVFDIRFKRSISVQEDREDRLDVLELLIDKANIEIKNNDDQTLFHVAAEEGNLRAVRLLVNKVVSISSEDNNYKTPEELLEEISQIEKLKSFISEKDELGYTPPHYAAKEGKWGTVNLFLDKAAKRDPGDVTNKDQLSESRTTVHYAVYNGDLNLIKDIFQFLSDKDVIVNTKDSSSWTPLHYAASYGACDVVEFLVGEGASIEVEDRDDKTPLEVASSGAEGMVKCLINCKDKDNKTPLYYTVAIGDLDRARFLLENGANIEAKNGEYQVTALHEAVTNNKLNVVQLLLGSGADIEAEDKDGWKPLHYAATSEWAFNIVEVLVEKGANISAKNNEGKTPLEVANEYNKYNQSKMVNFLVNKRDQHGCMLLHYAAQEGNLDLIKLLIINDAEIEAKNGEGKTPLEVAREYSKLEAAGILSINKDIKEGKLDEVKHFLANSASRSDTDAKDKDKWLKDWSLLHYAVYNGNLNLFKGVFELLLEKSGSINARDQYDWAPLHYAVYYNEPDIVSFLVDKGANINAQAKNRKTPLHVAAQYNSGSEITRLLLDRGANIEATASNNFTVLHDAVYYNKLDMVEFLVQRGANINAKNGRDETPLEVANRLGRSEIADFLRGKQNEKPVQRKRRHHHGDHDRHHSSRKPFAIDLSNQPEIAASSGARPSSWINDLFSWAKDSVGGLFSSRAALSGNSPTQREHTKLHYAAGEGELDLVKLRINQGYDISAKNEDGMTPLDIANLYRKSEVVSFLQEKQKEYNSLLLTAARNGNLNQVQNLLDRGANIEAKRNNGGAVLHEAVYYNRLDLVKLLVERGADINARNGQNETSLEAAKRSGKSQIANFLREVQDRQHSRRSIEQLYNDEMSYNKAKSGASRPFSRIKGSTGSPALLISGGHDSTTVTAVPEISADVVNGALALGDFAVRLINKTQYRQPTPDNLLSPSERLMRSDKGDIMRETILHSEHNKSKVKNTEEQQRNLEDKKQPRSYLDDSSVQDLLTQARGLRLR